MIALSNRIESNRSQLEITPLLVETFNGSKDHATLFHPHHKLNDVSPSHLTKFGDTRTDPEAVYSISSVTASYFAYIVPA
mmetsp:Transcript_19039/g.34539  ORF Transcript_19039/g.34539 Transcript_19039/m.34539 type:complete len:80 (-) Transcript_19039:178-417(-)